MFFCNRCSSPGMRSVSVWFVARALMYRASFTHAYTHRMFLFILFVNIIRQPKFISYVCLIVPSAFKGLYNWLTEFFVLFTDQRWKIIIFFDDVGLVYILHVFVKNAQCRLWCEYVLWITCDLLVETIFMCRVEKLGFLFIYYHSSFISVLLWTWYH